jgi:hypothetical protein
LATPLSNASSLWSPLTPTAKNTTINKFLINKRLTEFYKWQKSNSKKESRSLLTNKSIPNKSKTDSRITKIKYRGFFKSNKLKFKSNNIPKKR